MHKSFSLLVLLLVGTAAHADDWPQWLGPKRDGGTSEKVLVWKEPLKVLWRAPTGSGHSVPVIAKDRVFIHQRVQDKEEEEVLALDAKTGKELWRTPYVRPPYASVLNTGPQATPTVVGNRVFTFGINGLLTCFKADTGEKAWQVDVYKKFKVDLPRFGVCCSPVVIGNRLIVAVGGKGSSVIAFNTENGEVQWQALDEPASTGSPVLFASGDGTDVVFMTTLRVVALNPLDGTLSWEYPLVFQPSGTSPTPLVVGNQLIASTMTNGTTALRLDIKDNRPVASLMWQAKDLAAYFSSGTCVNKDHLYLITNTLKPIPNASLSCVELKTGKELWKKSAVGYFHAGIIRTGDSKLLILDDLGNLKLIQDDPQEYRELCRSKVCNGTLTNPALANGRVYVRDDKEVICLELP